MKTERRDFIKKTGVTALGVAGIIATGKVIADNTSPDILGELTKHELPSLTYSYNALEPFIDEQTMKLHHDIHHKGYVDGLNKAETELAKARATGDFSLIEYWSKKASFNGGGHFLHTLFWNCMDAPHEGPLKGKGGILPSGKLSKKISRDFGSFESFKKHFSAAATAVEGSGWALLLYRKSDDRLLVQQVENQHKLTPWSATPILGIDVWEHAYYLKYQNKRKDYVDAWWNVVNWEKVGENFDQA